MYVYDGLRGCTGQMPLLFQATNLDLLLASINANQLASQLSWPSMGNCNATYHVTNSVSNDAVEKQGCGCPPETQFEIAHLFGSLDCVTRWVPDLWR